MPDAPDIELCSKLCRHNPTDFIRYPRVGGSGGGGVYLRIGLQLRGILLVTRMITDRNWTPISPITIIYVKNLSKLVAEHLLGHESNFFI